jgi:hypothetical protein
MKIDVHPITITATVQVVPAPGEASALPDPVVELEKGDLTAQLTALIWKMCRDERRISRDLENVYDRMQDEAEQRAVDQKREKASSSLSEGLASGIGQIGSGGLTVGAGLSKNENLWKGLAEIASGGGKLGATGYHVAADLHDADATASEHAAAFAKRSAERMVEDARDLKKSIDDALDLYRQYCGAAIQAKKAAIHGG